MKLKNLRKDLGLAQKDIAVVFGCKQNHISSIETGARSITPLQIRLLIEKYGFDVVAKYADPSELPSSVVSVTAPVIHGNNNPVNGSGNQTVTTPSPDAELLSVMKAQSAQITTLLEQQARLISLLESKN